MGVSWTHIYILQVEEEENEDYEEDEEEDDDESDTESEDEFEDSDGVDFQHGTDEVRYLAFACFTMCIHLEKHVAQYITQHMMEKHNFQLVNWISCEKFLLDVLWLLVNKLA